MGSLAVAALFLAWATWRFVEQPFRKRAGSVLVTQRNVFLASGSVGALLVAVGLAGHIAKGFDWRVSADALRFEWAASDRAAGDDGCFFSQDDELPIHPLLNCMNVHENSSIDVMLLGDSHSLAISEQLGLMLIEGGISYYDVSYSGCLPLVGFRRFDAVVNHLCHEFNEAAFEYAFSAGITTVVLTGRFPLYLNGNRFDNEEGGVEAGGPAWIDLRTQVTSDWDDDVRRARVLMAYEERIRQLSERFNIVLVYPIPEAGWNVPSYGFKDAWFNGGDQPLATSYATYRQRTNEVNSLFDRLIAEIPNIFGARVHEVFCSEDIGRCINADAGGVYYYDDDHLSNAGARLVAPAILNAVRSALELRRARE
jgi:hypothetical protein